MPAALEAPPAAAPAAAPAPAPKTSQAPAPISAPPGSAKRPSAWDSVDADLGKAAGMPDEAPAKEAPKRPGAQEPPPGAKPEKPATADKPELGTTDGEPKPADATAPKGKASPWKLMDQFKARALKAEQELAEVQKRALPEQQWKETQERLTRAEKLAKDYEEEIRFTNYQKSAEFKTKYQEPYENAWRAAIGELNEIPVPDGPDGTSRRFNSEDMLELLNVSLPKARQIADEKYGPLADDVMAHRKTIRELYDAQQKAQDDAKTNGAARDKERQEQMARQSGELNNQIRAAFDAANKAITSHADHAEWFKPVEGDDEGNALLEKGLAFAYEAMKQNPLRPGLTPEQRTEAAKRHAALINRAAVYPRLRRAVKNLRTENATLKKELEQFKSSVPGNGGPSGQNDSPKPRGMDGLLGELDKLARPTY